MAGLGAAARSCAAAGGRGGSREWAGAVRYAARRAVPNGSAVRRALPGLSPRAGVHAVPVSAGGGGGGAGEPLPEPRVKPEGIRGTVNAPALGGLCQSVVDLCF